MFLFKHLEKYQSIVKLDHIPFGMARLPLAGMGRKAYVNEKYVKPPTWSFQLQKNNRRFGFLRVLGVLFFLRFLACFCGRLLGFCGRFAGFCGRFSEFPDLRDFAGVCVQN